MKTLIEKIQGQENCSLGQYREGLRQACRIIEAHTCEYKWEDSFWVSECGYDCDDHYYHCAKCGARIVEACDFSVKGENVRLL